MEVGNAKLILHWWRQTALLGQVVALDTIQLCPVSYRTIYSQCAGVNTTEEMAVYTLWYKNQLAGMIDLQCIDHVNRKAYIGYWLGQQFTRKGIMTLVVKVWWTLRLTLPT